MSDRLDVHLFDQQIGMVSIRGPHRSPEDWRFAYDPAWLESTHAVALSVSLSLRADEFDGAVVRNWFSNLLPEGTVREAVAERLRLPARDDFALLAAIGGECAGAVSVHSPGAINAPQDADFPDLETLLRELGGNVGEGAWSLLGAPLRLSLAGAQDKVVLVRDSEGKLRLPQPREPSTHILKPDSRRFPGLCELEALGLDLARSVGLHAARAQIAVIGGQRALLIERYDRLRDTKGRVQRLHQEDLCQALGYPAELKYQSLGGPSLAACSSLLRNLALGPTAVQGLLDWVIFNVLIGNADAHGKNLAILSAPTGARWLAPMYDLVPTIALPERLVDRALAQRIGHATRIESVTADDWRQFAREAGYAPRYVLARVSGLAKALRVRLPTTAEALSAQGADPVRIDRAVAAIAAQIDRIAQQA